jgi:hypothetical protein
MKLRRGDQIHIEERPAHELTHVQVRLVLGLSHTQAQKHGGLKYKVSGTESGVK